MYAEALSEATKHFFQSTSNTLKTHTHEQTDLIRPTPGKCPLQL